MLTGVAITVLVINAIAVSLKFIQSMLIANLAQYLELDIILEFWIKFFER
ncbi:MAG: hypothetical protein F6K35_09345 [Okeania sp. SIO2H7]|nr:hypothetical protein [Okeania sp. SIO2H7]